MSILENKYIPMYGFATYTIDIRPKKVDPTGRIRTPEEIKNGTFQFVHTIYIDYCSNVYLIPMKCDDEGEWNDYFSPDDIVKAAHGDQNAKKLIEDCRAEIIALYKKDLLSDSFLQTLYEREKDQILASVNKNRLEEGETILNVTLPLSPKTVNNFTTMEIVAVLHTARTINS